MLQNALYHNNRSIHAVLHSRFWKKQRKSFKLYTIDFNNCLAYDKYISYLDNLDYPDNIPIRSKRKYKVYQNTGKPQISQIVIFQVQYATNIWIRFPYIASYLSRAGERIFCKNSGKMSWKQQNGPTRKSSDGLNEEVFRPRRLPVQIHGVLEILETKVGQKFLNDWQVCKQLCNSTITYSSKVMLRRLFKILKNYNKPENRRTQHHKC